LRGLERLPWNKKDLPEREIKGGGILSKEQKEKILGPKFELGLLEYAGEQEGKKEATENRKRGEKKTTTLVKGLDYFLGGRAKKALSTRSHGYSTAAPDFAEVERGQPPGDFI